jgi:Flp pilus assembly CpaE family ATPase
LLCDFDLRLGILSFLLKLPAQHSLREALEIGNKIDHALWKQLVHRLEDPDLQTLDLLTSEPAVLSRPDPESAAAPLLEFARHLYTLLCVDLPGEMREHEVDAIRRAHECFLVCTPEIAAIHLAKTKAGMLRSLKADGKTSVILNRWSASGFMPLHGFTRMKDVEDMLELPVRFVVPNSWREINQAIEEGSPLANPSPAVTVIESIGRYIAGLEPGPQPKSRRFLDLFRRTPVMCGAGAR